MLRGDYWKNAYQQQQSSRPAATPQQSAGQQSSPPAAPQASPASPSPPAAYSAYSPAATQAPYAAYQAAPQQAAPPPTPAAPTIQPADSAAAIRDLLQGYGVPQNVLNQIGGMFGGQQGGERSGPNGEPPSSGFYRSTMDTSGPGGTPSVTRWISSGGGGDGAGGQQGGEQQGGEQQGGSEVPPAENPQDRFTVDRGPQEFDYDGRLQELVSQIRMAPGVPARIAETNYSNAVNRAIEQVNAEQRRHNDARRGTGGTRQRSEQELARDAEMNALWEQVAGREEWTPTGGQRVGGLSEEQSRAMRADPEGQRFLDQLTEWKRTGTVPDDFQVPSALRNQSSPGAAQAVQDPYATSTPYTPQGNPAATNPLVPSTQNFLPPPPVDPSWGSPGAQQQMFNNSMMAWTMPKQSLLQWGQQAAQMPWSPNYGNLPDQFRPSPYSIEPNNAFGVGAQGQQNRDAFIQSILTSQANQFTGTYQGNDNPGRFNRVNYDPSALWGQATKLLQGGYVNPFLNLGGNG